MANRVKYQVVRLSNLIRRLLEPSLSGVDATIAFVNVLLHVPEVVVLEAVLLLLARRGRLPFRLQRLAVHLGTWPQVLLRVREQVVRTRAGDEGSACAWVGQGHLWRAGGAGTHELFWRASCQLLGGGGGGGGW